jgi:hypothetical protein
VERGKQNAATSIGRFRPVRNHEDSPKLLLIGTSGAGFQYQFQPGLSSMQPPQSDGSNISILMLLCSYALFKGTPGAGFQYQSFQPAPPQVS